jgi:hypothetical protein
MLVAGGVVNALLLPFVNNMKFWTSEVLCEGVCPVWTPLPEPADHPNRPPMSVPSVAPATRPACSYSFSRSAPCLTPLLLLLLCAPAPLSSRATPALPPAPPDDTDRCRQLKEKHQALVRKPSGLASCYGCDASMQAAEEAAPRYDAYCKCTFQMF